jgi:Flp pilus assembly protein protease CpaA
MCTAPAPAPTLDRPAPAATLRRAYRRLLAVPARTRVAIGFAGPLVAVAGCAAFSAAFPASPVRPTPVAGLLAWTLAAAVASDLVWRRIFNWVLGPALVWVGLLHAARAAGLSTGLPPFDESAAGLGICFGLMLALYLTFRGGEGDVKLVPVLGAMVGWWHGVEAAVVGYLAAAAVAGLIVVVRFAGRTVDTPTTRKPLFAGHLPMAPFFAAGVLFTLA